MSKRDRKKQLVSWFIILVMISGVFGFVFSFIGNPGSNTANVQYNGITLSYEDGLYTTELQGQDVFFYYDPFIIESVNTPEGFDTALRSGTARFTIDQNDTQVGLLTSMFFEVQEIVPASFAYTTDARVPAVTCENATQTNPVFYAKSAQEFSVNLTNNCYILNIAQQGDAGFARDRMLYGYFGVING